MPDNYYNKNSTILAAALMEGSTDFQQLADAASQGRMAEVIAAFNMPNADQLFQEVTGLFKTIGITRIKSQRFENPLEFLESNMMSTGGSVREIATRWAKTRCYSSDSQSLLKRRLPSFVEAFHALDRFEKWEASVTLPELVQSLQPGIGGEDGTGLDTLLGSIFDSLYSPEAYGSMRYTLNTIAEADRSWGKLNGRGTNGLMRVAVPEIVDKATGAQFMQTIEALALRWKFPSTIYNNMPGLPVFSRPEDLVVMCTPETLAAIDFQTIANLFHEERAEDVRRRIVVVPDFPIPNVRAVLCDRNFFVIHRSYFGLGSFYDANTISTKYILHSQGVWSASPLANIVLLGDFEDTEINTVTVAPSTLTITPEKATVAVGGRVGIRAELTGDVTASVEGAGTGCICVKPDSVVWTVEAPEGTTLNRKTFVDRFGVLHVQKTIDEGVALTVKATSTYINPSGETQEFAAEVEITTEAPNPCCMDSTAEEQLAYTDVRDAVLNDSAIEGLDQVNP